MTTAAAGPAAAAPAPAPPAATPPEPPAELAAAPPPAPAVADFVPAALAADPPLPPPPSRTFLTPSPCAFAGTGTGRFTALLASCSLPMAWYRSKPRSEEHTSELQSRGHIVCRIVLEKKK